jgi:hypothetical protein
MVGNDSIIYSHSYLDNFQVREMKSTTRFSIFGVAAIAIGFGAIINTPIAAATEDYAALYKKLDADILKCESDRDGVQRIKCFDKLAGDLELRQSLFPIKERTPPPERDPFEILARTPEKK